MRLKDYSIWAICGGSSYAFFGTAFTCLLSYRPPVTSAQISHPWILVCFILIIFAGVGVVLGVIGCKHSDSYHFENRRTGGAMTTFFLAFWGAVLCALVSAFLIPDPFGVSLSPTIERIGIGALSGFLAGPLAILLARKIS